MRRRLLSFSISDHPPLLGEKGRGDKNFFYLCPGPGAVALRQKFPWQPGKNTIFPYFVECFSPGRIGLKLTLNPLNPALS